MKTAMVMDSTTKKDVDFFYTMHERKSLMESRVISPRTFVWLARFIGGASIVGGYSTDTRYRLDLLPGSHPIRTTTFLIGSVMIQVMTIHVLKVFNILAPDENGYRTAMLDPIPGPWDDTLVSIWPTKRSVYWPPPLAFDMSRTILNFRLVDKRWERGREVKLV